MPNESTDCQEMKQLQMLLRQINPDVFPMFPITPSTEIPQYFATLCMQMD